MNIRYGLTSAPASSRVGASLAEHRHRLQHLPHNLRLQLWKLRLKSLRHGIFDALPRLVLFSFCFSF